MCKNFIYWFVYTACVYMKDIYDATLMCENCNVKTIKQVVIKDGFQMRTWSCPKCGKHWFHPTDLEAYKGFIELRKREFQVKLREVGNSWIVSIPKEIIRFEEISLTRVVNLNMDEPGKVILWFKKVKKVGG